MPRLSQENPDHHDGKAPLASSDTCLLFSQQASEIVCFDANLVRSVLLCLRSRYWTFRALLVTSLFRLPFLGQSVPPTVLSADGRILTMGTLNMADCRKLALLFVRVRKKWADEGAQDHLILLFKLIPLCSEIQILQQFLKSFR